MVKRRPGFGWLGLAPVGLAMLIACSRKAESTAPTPSSSPSANPAPPLPSNVAPAASSPDAPSPSAAPAESASPTSSAARYAWLASDAGRALKVDGTVESRFKPPPGYTRLPVEPESFSAWLRGLPMAPADSAVVRYDGTVTRAADDEYLAGVVAIDVGATDLQQSADALVRLHAEWQWSRGARAEISYPGSTRLSMPLARWEKGQRVVAEGANLYWALQAKPVTIDHAEFRRFLDHVFTWATSASLTRLATRVEDPTTLVPGDFFLHTKAPGHVAIVLDVAAKPNGDRLALLGQALSPAESIHIVRPGRATAWFSLRPGRDLFTPHSAAFGWDELRRFPSTQKNAEDSGG